MFSNMARNKSTTQTATSYSLKANSNPRQANHMSHDIQFLHRTIGNQAVQRMLSPSKPPANVIQMKKAVFIDNKNVKPNPEYMFDEGELAQAEGVEALEKAASIILRSLGYDQILLPEIQQCLTQADVTCLIEGKPIQNKKLNAILRYPKRLELQTDDLLTRPWLRDMYGIHDKETESRPNHSVLSLNTTVPEANNLQDELNVKKVGHVKKGNKDNSNEIRDLISNCMDDIAGDMSVTLCGHINYNESENPEDWTLAGLNIETIVSYLEKAVENNVSELKTFAQLNLLVCGSEKFAEHLFRTLTKLDAAPKIMTAIRDEIPITPAPRGAQKFQYMFSGDYEDESAGRGENLLNSVLKLEMNESGEIKKSNMEKHVIDKMREIAIETLKHKSIIDNITKYMLPETPSMEKLNTVRHN